MDMKKMADRLRMAREAMNMTQENAAVFLALPRTAITKIENGDRHISSLELTKLAKLYHRSINFFFHDEIRNDFIVELHRIAPGFDKNPEVKEQVNSCIDLCREGIILENILGYTERTYLPSYANIISRTAQEALKHGEQIAKEERRRLGLGSSPIGDISELISNQNIWMSSANLPDSMSGFFIHCRSIGRAIFVNEKHAHGRQRFSIAHEYAHALLDRDQAITVSNEDNKSEIREKRANAFAAAFLMPEEGVRDFLSAMNKGALAREEKILYDPASEEEIKISVRSDHKSQQITYQDLASIAHHFGVSYVAAVYRLLNLHLMTKNESKELIESENLGKQYLRALGMFDDFEGMQHKEHKNRELRKQILRLTIEGYRRELISRGKLLDLGKLLNISSDEIVELAEAA